MPQHHRATYLCLSLVAGTLSLFAQVPVAGAPKTDAQLDDEARQARQLYESTQALASLPLYEDLHAARPANVFYTERLAMAYVARANATTVPADRAKALARARALVTEARNGGDNSDLLQVMSEKLSASDEPVASSGPVAPGKESFDQAELLFNKGDLNAALALYRKSWEQNPKFYYAPLYAGDSEYKLGHPDEAGTWYLRAIAIDPDRETAHRYWADVLMKNGKASEAGRQYLLAYVGDPYSKAPRLSLLAWARASAQRFAPPPISLPAEPTRTAEGHINITIPAGDKEDPLAAASLMYSMNAATWQGDKFKQHFPKEKIYRHSLAEELEGLDLVLTSLHAQKLPEAKLSPTAKSLMALEKDGMLACWVLLDNPDNGTVQDYAGYRKDHHDLLLAYIQKYDLHPT